jgi:two-component sensor histidine kinase
MQFVMTLRSLRQHPWFGVAIALFIFLLAFAVRYWVGTEYAISPFVTLFAAIALSALFGGLWVGVLVTALSAIVSVYWFIPPYDAFVLDWPHGYVAVVLFLVTAAVQLYVIEKLNRAVEGRAGERDRADVMFQELQHRVANNMQFVAGLLQLQGRSIEADPASAAQVLAQAKARLETMARIHRKLYDPVSVGLPLGRYFQELCTDILDVSGARNVVCVVETVPATLDLRRLVTLSLLVSETITNSVKHAFADGRKGTISVRLDRDSEKTFALTVQDDGSGLPANFNIGATRSLGFRIIQSLAEQLGGTVTHDGTAGMRTRLVFPA